jgi:hypothetical protein
MNMALRVPFVSLVGALAIAPNAGAIVYFRRHFAPQGQLVRVLLLRSLLLLIACSGCQTTNPTIPAGTYTEAKSPNYIKIARRKMVVHMQNASYPYREPTERDCIYTLFDDGRISLTLPGRSAEFVYGIGRFDYLWTGKGITVTDPKTGKTAAFSQAP